MGPEFADVLPAFRRARGDHLNRLRHRDKPPRQRGDERRVLRAQHIDVEARRRPLRPRAGVKPQGAVKLGRHPVHGAHFGDVGERRAAGAKGRRQARIEVVLRPQDGALGVRVYPVGGDHGETARLGVAHAEGGEQVGELRGRRLIEAAPQSLPLSQSPPPTGRIISARTDSNKAVNVETARRIRELHLRRPVGQRRVDRRQKQRMVDRQPQGSAFGRIENFPQGDTGEDFNAHGAPIGLRSIRTVGRALRRQPRPFGNADRDKRQGRDHQ